MTQYETYVNPWETSPFKEWEPKLCLEGDYAGWKDMFYCISPLAWLHMGLGVAMGLSIFGSAW